MDAPITINLSMALAQSPAEPLAPGFTRYLYEFQSTSFRKGYAASLSFFAASPIGSAHAGAEATAAAAGMATDAPLRRGDGTNAGRNLAKTANAAAQTRNFLPRAMLVVLWGKTGR